MAKRRSGNVEDDAARADVAEARARETRHGAHTIGEAQGRMIDFAEDLGTLLGTAQKKASTWLEQRRDLTEQLTKIRDTADDMLGQLTSGGARLAAAVRRGRRSGQARIMKKTNEMGLRRGPGRPKGSTNRTRKGVRTVSEETRQKMAEAARRRWAARKAESGGKKR
jgi:hypothetical protein